MTSGRPTALRASTLAWSLWIGLLAAVVWLLLTTPTPLRRTVTPNFRDASLHWWRSESIYELDESDLHGYLYFPQSAILFTPFALPSLTDRASRAAGASMPAARGAGAGEAEASPFGAGWGFRAGEVAWRIACVLVLALGLRRMCAVAAADPPWREAKLPDEAARRRAGDLFLASTVLCLGIAWGSLRNGQMNVPLAALMLHAGADLALGRWRAAGAWLALVVALKPLGAVPLLLALALFPRVRGWAIAGLLAAAAMPWLHPDPAYVWGQHVECLAKLRSAAKPPPGEYSDLTTVLFSAGRALHAMGWAASPESLVPPGVVMTAVRGAAAVLTLVLSWMALRRFGAARGVILTMTLAAAYLMLMNPRTEGNTYIVLGPFAAILAAWAITGRASWARIVPLVAFTMILAFAREVFHGGQWLRPAATVVFVAWIARLVLRDGARADTASAPG